ncbi:hypothetical protein ABMA09_19405 [Erwinia rhapontici]
MNTLRAATNWCVTVADDLSAIHHPRARHAWPLRYTFDIGVGAGHDPLQRYTFDIGVGAGHDPLQRYTFDIGVGAGHVRSYDIPLILA